MDYKKEKTPAESFGDLVKEFGDAVGKIFDDPDLKKKAKDFGDSALKSAKLFGDRFRDEEVKKKFRDVGRAAMVFGNSVSDYFKDEKEKAEGDNTKKKDDLESKAKDKVDESSNNAGKTGKESGEIMDRTRKNMNRYFEETRGGRITGYAFSIFFSTLFLIFLYYYNDYIAFYSKVGGIWMRYPFLTGDFDRWLPLAISALLAGIVGYIVLIIYDGYFFRQVVHIIIDIFSLAAAISLLIIFPFDFSVIPGSDLSGILNPIVTVVLILIVVGIGVGILVRFIKLIISIVR
jgi:vacuolar-type H+-ATPase subunit H